VLQLKQSTGILTDTDVKQMNTILQTNAPQTDTTASAAAPAMAPMTAPAPVSAPAASTATPPAATPPRS
jgi:hypothetical protein